MDSVLGCVPGHDSFPAIASVHCVMIENTWQVAVM